LFVCFYFILFYFILFYFILFYFILFYFILFYFIFFFFFFFFCFILFYFILFYFVVLFVFFQLETTPGLQVPATTMSTVSTVHEHMNVHGTSTISDEGVLLFRSALPSLTNAKEFSGMSS